jgi:hypothetical protein
MFYGLVFRSSLQIFLKVRYFKAGILCVMVSEAHQESHRGVWYFERSASATSFTSCNIYIFVSNLK